MKHKPVTTIRYRPALTVVHITGTAIGTDDGTETTSKIALGTMGDPGCPIDLTVPEHILEDQGFDLKLTPDQRLTGASVSATGVVPEIVEAVVRVGTEVMWVGTHLTFMAEQVDEETDSKRVREELTKLVSELQNELIQVLGGSDENGADIEKQGEKAEALGKALQVVREEKAHLDADFAKRKAQRAISYAWDIPVDRLPVVTEASLTREFKVLSGDARDAARLLSVIVALVGNVRDPNENGPREPEDDKAIKFRYPRWVRLATYKRMSDAKPTEYRLQRVTPALVVDKWSSWGVIPIESKLFGKYSATAEFSDAGTLSHVANKEASGVGRGATVVSAAGGQIKDALDQVAAIRSAFAPTPAPANQALEAEVARKELEARLVVAERKIAGSTNGTT